MIDRPPEHPSIKVDIAAPRSPPKLSAGLAKYFYHALRRLNYLEYGDPSEYLLRWKRINAPHTPLSEVWVPPRFRKTGGEDIQIGTFLADKSTCLLILADPGFGKTTLARYITCLLIEDYQIGASNQFGIYVPLSLLKTRGMSHYEAVALCAASYVGLGTDEGVIKDLKEGLATARVIFDGFDEVPCGRRGDASNSVTRGEAAELITVLRHRHPYLQHTVDPIRSIVTCRQADYSNDLDVPHYVLSRFLPDQRNRAICVWHDAARKQMQKLLPDDTTSLMHLSERAGAILSTLRDNADLGELCLTPLMLSILQTVFAGSPGSQWDLPASVSQLCSRAVNWMLIDKQQGPGLSPVIRDNANWLVEVVEALGWYLHSNYVANRAKGFDDDDLRRITKGVSPLKGLTGTHIDDHEDAVTSVCSFIRRGHGILVPLSDGRFDFAHSMLREVMAGRALGRLPVPERRQYALNEHWAGPIRYWAGVCAAQPSGSYEISAFIHELEADVTEGSLTAILARAEMLVEVCLVKGIATFHRNLSELVPAVKGELKEALFRPDIQRGTRVRIGDLLSVLGDPVLEVPWADKVEWIESCLCEIGTSENHPSKLEKYGSCPASPIIKGFISGFGIGRLLVTNSEYSRFMDAGGYLKAEFWPSALAWSWANGDRTTRANLIAKSRDLAPTHFSSEFASRRLVPDEVPDRCTQMIDRSTPLYWIDPSFNRPNQPVVGVNWWEAMAYCAWLTNELHDQGVLPPDQTVRLPIEVEWETAARQCGNNTYPWISGAPSDCAHVRTTTDVAPIMRSCAVGLFRATPTRLPIFDMAGNVWEWTASLSRPYSDESFAVSIQSDGIDDRIARGSSWLSREEEAAKVTFRSFDPPYNAYDDLGFRYVVSAAIS